MLSFQNFSKAYGEVPVLDLPELTMPTGIHWVKGRNGSGKTTLFKVLAGLLPYQGHIFLNSSVSLANQPVRHRTLVNYAEAEPLYPSFLTGSDLVNLVAKAKKAPSGQPSALADALGIDFLNKPTGTYSSGMLKKLSLLLAFLGEPALILLDEPLITLDTAAVQEMYALIKEYHQQKEVSFLITSHQDLEMPELPHTAAWLVQDQTLRQVGVN